MALSEHYKLPFDRKQSRVTAHSCVTSRQQLYAATLLVLKLKHKGSNLARRHDTSLWPARRDGFARVGSQVFVCVELATS